MATWLCECSFLSIRNYDSDRLEVQALGAPSNAGSLTRNFGRPKEFTGCPLFVTVWRNAVISIMNDCTIAVH